MAKSIIDENIKIKNNNKLSANKEYLEFNQQDLLTLKKEFKSKLMFYKGEALVIYNNNKGFKIYQDFKTKKFWLYLIFFPNLINFKKPIYFNEWNGPVIITIWKNTLNEIIENTKENFMFSRIKQNNLKVYLVSYDENKKLIYTTKNYEERKIFVYSEYYKFLDWYEKNRIYIRETSVLPKGVINNQNVIKHKFLDIPRKINSIFTIIEDEPYKDLKLRKYNICIEWKGN